MLTIEMGQARMRERLHEADERRLLRDYRVVASGLRAGALRGAIERIRRTA